MMIFNLSMMRMRCLKLREFYKLTLKLVLWACHSEDIFAPKTGTTQNNTKQNDDRNVGGEMAHQIGIRILKFISSP